MNKIKISHEAPLCLLKFMSDHINDYTYCLTHLLSNDEYKQHIQDEILFNRMVIFDNSIFEGQPLSMVEYINVLSEMMPSEYIIPDVMDDMKGTEENVHKWNELVGIRIKPNNVNKLTSIGVIQGTTLEEIEKSYVFMSQNVDKIAINFASKAYNEIVGTNNKTHNRLKGRPSLIKYLMDKNIWRYDKPHHLLGCELPSEFIGYNHPKFNDSIVSIDTSSPVIAACDGTSFDARGVTKKSKTVIDDIFHNKYSGHDFRMELARNCNIFSEMVNGEMDGAGGYTLCHTKKSVSKFIG